MDVSWFQWSVLIGASIAAGMVNAVAGGGTLLTFPALLWVLGPSAAASVIANATSTITVCPASLASAWGYRRELRAVKNWILPLLVPSLAGAYVGTRLVTERDPEEFLVLVPWLILLATSLFLLQPSVARWIKIGAVKAKPEQPAATGPSESKGAIAPESGYAYLLGLLAFQFLIALYGGYFGAGIGILMLSTLALMGIADIHHMNSLKSLLAGTINAVAVVLFMGSSKISWPLAVPMMAASIAGGFLGAVMARRLDKNIVRYVVIAIGLILSTYYFIQTYLA